MNKITFLGNPLTPPTTAFYEHEIHDHTSTRSVFTAWPRLPPPLLFCMCEIEKKELCCASLLPLQPPRHVAVSMWQWVWESVRLCAASGEWLSKSLMKEQRRNQYISKAEKPPWPAFTSVFCAHFMYELYVTDKKGGETGRWDALACSPLSVSISFPSFLSFSTMSSNWILCGDVLSPISSLCFNLTIVPFPLHFSASTTPLALSPPYLRQDKHLSALSVQYFTTGGRMFYLPSLTHLQWLTHREALHNTVAREPGHRVTAGRSKVREPPGCQGRCVYNIREREWVTPAVQRSRQKSIAISWTGKAFRIPWDMKDKTIDVCVSLVTQPYLHPKTD